MFLSDALPVINIFNKMMQQEAPALHSLKQEVHSFLKKLILRFMNPQVLQIPLKDIDMNDTSVYKPLEQVFVGEKHRGIFLIVIYLAVKLRISIVHARNSGLQVRPMQ